MRRPAGDIAYEIIRSKRRTASISVDSDGYVRVRVPRNLSDRRVRELVESKRRWIRKHLAEWRARHSARRRRKYRNGEGFPYLGKSYRLLLVPGQEGGLKLRAGRFRMPADERGQAAGDPSEMFREFYQKKGREKIPARVERFRKSMGIGPVEVRVRDLGARWASCSKRGLNFHWKCMMVPQPVLDYVVVHELAHIRHPNHQRGFWDQVARIMPEYRTHHAWLKNNGADLELS